MPNAITKNFESALVGEGSLLAECGDALLAAGHKIRWVSTTDPALQSWAHSRLIEIGADLHEVDYLFSIVNLRMLPAKTLGLARRLAINFHDALLPENAGLNAPAWALWNQAAEHGVTWHVMSSTADTGDILKQRVVPIEPDETSFSLNMKCMESGLDSFRELIGELADGSAQPQTQDFSRRTYHGRTKRPAALVHSWSRSAAELDAAVRACRFGRHDNVFGVVKLWTGDDFAVVVESALTTEPSTAAPGTVVSTMDSWVTVATTTTDVRLCLDGVWQVQRFPELAQSPAVTDAVRHEAYWVTRLAEVNWLDIPCRTAGAAEVREFSVEAPAGMSDDSLFAAMLAFWARIGSGQDVGLALSHTEKLFAAVVPISVPSVCGDLPAYQEKVAAVLADARKHGSHLRDVAVRYPRLAGLAQPPIVLGPLGARVAGAAVHVQVGEAACRWWVDLAQMSEQDAEALRESCATYLSGLDGQPVDQAPLVSPAQWDRIGRQWNDTAAPYPHQKTVSQQISDQAHKNPQAPALVCGPTTLTYRELDERSNRLARHLAGLGAGRGELIGVQLPRTADLVIALLAVMKTGAAYVPLDPVYPQERIDAMMRDANARLVVTCTDVLGDDSPFDQSDPDGLAYVIYTSGSTGTPKGVRIGHRALTNFLCSMADRPGFTSADRILALTTICFDIAALEIFLPLVAGGVVEMVSAEIAADGVALGHLMTASRPTVVQATPATWKMLINAGWTGSRELTVLCGGEALPPTLAEALLERAAAVWNMYGPTETTIWSTVSSVQPGQSITLGTPIANTQCYVLDSAMRPLPPGVPGELCIGGDGVAAGYHDRPDLTAERFPETPYGRLYRTGDVVRWNHHGELEFSGRSDHQVKIRGFRIELGEIETALTRHPELTQAIVVVRPDGHGESQLVGYVVPAHGHRVQAAVLREFLGASLPAYMVPAAIVVLDAFPLTLNGKVDRKALPAPDPVAVGRPPRTPLEAKLCALFADALGRDEVGADDSLLDLGGTSLTAARLSARARDAGLEFRARDLFAHPTPAALALHIGQIAPIVASLNLESEVVLAADITPAPQQILLTGATGFLGAYLLRDLARAHPDSVIHCLVRGDDPHEALRRAADRYGLELPDQVRVVAGDLTALRFGLSEAEFDRLSREIDVIFHAGAVVSWLHTYGDLKAANVTGTEQILRLAARHRTVPVHYVSSMGVFAQGRPGGARHAVTAPTGPPERLMTGYQQSKWVAEGTLRIARQRGLPISIYRAARISGDRHTGACQADDYLWRILKGCLQVQAVPANVDIDYDLVPVDYVSAAIVELSQQPTGATHHLSNPDLTSFADIVAHLRKAGYQLTEIDHAKWAQLIAADPANPAHLLAESFLATVVDVANREIPLDPSGSPLCPRIDQRVLDTYLGFFVRSGYFPAS